MPSLGKKSILGNHQFFYRSTNLTLQFGLEKITQFILTMEALHILILLLYRFLIL